MSTFAVKAASVSTIRIDQADGTNRESFKVDFDGDIRFSIWFDPQDLPTFVPGGSYLVEITRAPDEVEP